MSQLPPQSVFFGLAILASLAVVLGNSRRVRVEPATAFGLFSLGVMSAVVGARIVWVLASPEAGLAAAVEQPEIVWHPLRGGYASLGGWGGAAGVLVLATGGWSRTDRWRFADVAAPGALVGMAVARMGCLSNGCDYGVVQSWGIRYASGTPAYREHLHHGWITLEAARSLPTFPLPPIMSSATLFIAVAALIAVRRLQVGKTALYCCAAYFGSRIVLELFRAPSTVERVAGPINVNHLMAVAGLLLAMGAWRYFRPSTPQGGVN